MAASIYTYGNIEDDQTTIHAILLALIHTLPLLCSV